MRLLIDSTHGLGPGLALTTHHSASPITPCCPSAGALAVSHVGSLLPRTSRSSTNHRRFLTSPREVPGDEAKVARLSLIDEHDQKYVRMAYLACVGSHYHQRRRELHTELLKKELFHDFYELWRISSSTLPTASRRGGGLAVSNSRAVGAGDQQDWRRLDLRFGPTASTEAYAGDAAFRADCARYSAT